MKEYLGFRTTEYVSGDGNAVLEANASPKKTGDTARIRESCNPPWCDARSRMCAPHHLACCSNLAGRASDDARLRRVSLCRWPLAEGTLLLSRTWGCAAK